MHRIISESDELNIGPKASNLIKLDKLGLTPNFLVLDSSIFFKHIREKTEEEIKKEVIAKEIDERVLFSIREALESLNITGPILRSSYLFEDSENCSFAGMFDSYVCESDQLESFIKKIWLSQFNERVKSYAMEKRMELPLGMAVIIQEYIEPDCGGVVFFDRKNREVYVEFTEGSSSDVQLGRKNPYFFILKNNIRLVPDKKIDEFPWLQNFNLTIESLELFPEERIDAEIVVSRDNIFLVQARVLAKKPDLNHSLIFRKLRPNDFFPHIMTSGKVNSLIHWAGFTKKLKITNIENTLFAHYGDLSEFLDELYEKKSDLRFISRFYGRIVFFQKREILNSEMEKDPKKILSRFKDYELSMYILDHLINLLISMMKDSLAEKKISEATHPDVFTPHKISLTSFALYSLLKTGKTPFSNKLLLRKANQLIDKNGLKERIEKIFYSKKEESVGKDEFIENFRKLIWLHDANNYFIDTVSYNYSESFRAATRRNVDDVLLRLKEKANLTLSKRAVNSEFENSEKSIVHQLSLVGFVASKGDFEGFAKKITLNDALLSVGSDEIIVAHETYPSLVTGMANCRGIITEKGGLTSHAAIVSRELNIPCVVGVKDCTRLIKDGEFLIVKNGVVFRK